MSISAFETWSLNVCVTGLIPYMLFIIYRPAKDTNAGSFGYFVRFGAVGLGVLGFLAKTVIVETMLHI